MTHTLLLVEDEVELREMVADLLRRKGYTVVTAAEGEEAFRVLPDIERLSLVILDLLMPGMNGWEFFEAFRKRAEFSHVPIVIHSSAGHRAPIGAARVLQKPVSPRELLSVVGELCAS